jgi:hypothetical protein
MCADGAKISPTVLLKLLVLYGRAFGCCYQAIITEEIDVILNADIFSGNNVNRR